MFKNGTSSRDRDPVFDDDSRWFNIPKYDEVANLYASANTNTAKSMEEHSNSGVGRKPSW